MMNGPHWLDAEYWRATRQAGEKTVATLRRYGVPIGVWGGLSTGFPVYGLERVAADDDGFYEPSEDGQVAIIQPAVDSAQSYDPEIIDLVAWHIDEPGRWWVRTGAAPVIDREAVDRASLGFLGSEPETLILHSTPFDYLVAGCCGTVPLRMDGGTAFWLGSARKILAADGEQALRLAESINAGSIPDIRYQEEKRNAA